MAKRKVGENQSTSSLALATGHYWKTIWEDGQNAELKAKRKDPNVLSPEDDIYIRPIEIKKVSKGTEAEHPFIRRGEPTKIKMQLMELGEPRKDAPYVFECEGKVVNGTTNGEGILEQFVPGSAKSAILTFKDGQEIHNLKIGSLNPLALLSGIIQRLNNCGFKCSSSLDDLMDAKEAFESEDIEPKCVRALKNFQAQNDLEPTGKLDDATFAKFEEVCK